MLLDGRQARGEHTDGGKRETAEMRGFQCDGIAGKVVGENSVKTDDFTREIKPQHMFPSIFIRQAHFDGAGAYRINATERIAIAEDILSLSVGANMFDKTMEVRQFPVSAACYRTDSGKCTAVTEALRVVAAGEWT